MRTFDLSAGRSCEDGRFEAVVLFEQDPMKIRRIELVAGARIPPCRMAEDAVFVVVEGRVTFRAEGEESVVQAPGALFIPGGAATRSMEAGEPSLVLAVLCRRPGGPAVS